MKKSMKVFGVLIYSALTMISCGKNPTKCECIEELNKTMQNSILTGQSETTDLNDKCDRIYGGVEGYINEKCPENK
jgi:hypothetical protein